MKNSRHRLHTLESLGHTHVSRGEVRIEKLEERLEPRVPFPHKHDFYQFIWVSAGQGWHAIDFKRFSLRTGQAYFIKPGQIHAWKISSAKGFIIEFTIESLRLDLKHDLLQNIADEITFKNGIDRDVIGTLCQMAIQEFQHKQELSDPLLRSYLTSLMLILKRRTVNPQTAAHETLIGKFQADVEAYFTQQREISFYAKRLGLTPKALTMRVSRATGKSARNYILNRTVLESKRRLVESTESIAEIGYDLGFEDPNYFARFFRDKTGQTPTAFRKAQSKT